ncbi:hypothetical protein TWF696_003508 [Orbilia brochopaga]|uniref:Zn(2)-C6 fungal-type domain-containing protein n=1 Tax=Orbilia brochopaga TaxID=3140254 RepID=A0AAV9TZP8_9PEZI
MSGRDSTSKVPLRRLRPAPALQPRPNMVAKAIKKIRAKNACLQCQQSKKKCNEGKPQCGSCKEADIECGYSIKNSVRHKRMTIRSKMKEYESDIEKYERVLEYIKNSSVPALQRVLDVIRGQVPLEDIIVFIRNDKTPYLPTDIISPELVTSDLSLLMNQQGNDWQLQDFCLDTEHIDDRPLLNLSASPWTTVTDDDELVSHLMSLYMIWDHPAWHLFDFDIFLDATKHEDRTYCSPLLVNATLAEACVSYDAPSDPQCHSDAEQSGRSTAVFPSLRR